MNGFTFCHLAVVAASLSAANAWAKGPAAAVGIPVGKGQVDTAFTDPVVTTHRNPAGFAGTLNGMQVYGMAHTHSDDDAPIGYGGGLLYGGPAFTAGAGAASSTADGADPELNGALAFSLGKSFALGVGVSYYTGDTLDDDDDALGLRAGLLVNPGQTFRVGVAAYNLASENGKWLGAGIGYQLAAPVSLTVDATTDEEFENFEMAGGLRVSGQALAFSGTYHFNPETENDGFSLALGIAFAGGSYLRLGYEDINKYFAALSITL